MFLVHYDRMSKLGDEVQFTKHMHFR